MKAYYHLKVPAVCGLCGYQMRSDGIRNESKDRIFRPVVYCYFKPDCPQLGVRIKLEPIEVEVEEA